MSSVAQLPNVPTRSIEPKQCCDQIGEALGRCWTWIVNGWHWCVDKVFQAVDVVAFSFFRVVGCFAPKWALKLEAGYGYIATWYARHKAAVAQEISQTTIADLEVVNRGLNKDVLQSAGDVAVLQVAHTQAVSEKNRLSAERNADIRARVLMEGQHQQMQQEVRFIQAREVALKAENQRMQEQLQGMIAGRAPVLGKNMELVDALDNSKRENQLLQLKLQYAETERDLAYRSLELLKDLSDRPIHIPQHCQNMAAKEPSLTMVATH